MVKIGFIGCHEISWHCLKKICELSKQYKDSVNVVFNLNEEEASKHSATVDFTSLSIQYNFDLHNVGNVTDKENLKILSEYNLDILFIIGWHRIVPQSVLDTAQIRLGIHSSILPKDRGPSPINWQIIRGQTQGGVTLFHLTTGVDSGNIIDLEKYKIEFEDNVRDVYSKATIASLNLLQKNWKDIHNLQPKSIPQNEQDVTINDRRRPDDGIIDWNKNSHDCYNWIRALTKPYPGAFTFWNKKKIFLWESKISTLKETSPGKILETGNRIIISAVTGSIEILSLQVEGESICDAEMFSHSYGLTTDDFF